jgi:hypothetical protein
LQRNPIRYDSEGEELDEEDEDSEADAAAAEENPFSGIALESMPSIYLTRYYYERLTLNFLLQRYYALSNTPPNYPSILRWPTLTPHRLLSK